MTINKKNENKAVVLLGHGSKKEDANKVLTDLARMLELESDYPVYSSFLQFTSPTLEDTIEKITQNGVEKIIVVPVFLFPGVHLTQDIPEILEDLKEKHPHSTFYLSGPIGADERLVPILHERVEKPLKSE